MVMTSHPQGLTTLLTRLLQRDQRLLLRRFWTRTSASHLLAPCCTFLLLLCLFTSCFFPAYTCCQHRFAIQRFFYTNGELSFLGTICGFLVVELFRKKSF